MAIRWIGSDLPDVRHLLQISATSGHHPRAAAPAKNDAEENASCLAWFAASMLPSRKHKLAENVDFRLQFEQENIPIICFNCCCLLRRSTAPPLGSNILTGRYRVCKQTTIFDYLAGWQCRFERNSAAVHSERGRFSLCSALFISCWILAVIFDANFS